MQLETVPTTHPEAERLLTAYFGSRELEFAAADSNYRVVFPDASLFEPPHGLFVLVRDDSGVAVGCGGIRRIADAVAGDGAGTPVIRYEVKHVWLEESARGRGWATELMNQLEGAAVGFGAGELVLDTNARLVAAARLYARLGYLPIEPYNENPNATNWYGKAVWA